MKIWIVVGQTYDEDAAGETCFGNVAMLGAFDTLEHAQRISSQEDWPYWGSAPQVVECEINSEEIAYV